MLLGYGVKPDHGEHYHGVWESITHYGATGDGSEDYQRRSIDIFRLLLDDYEEHSYLLNFISNGIAPFTEKDRSSSESVWLFHQSQAYLVGLELANFQDAILRGVFVNCIWDMNLEGLEWFRDIVHTPAGARLCEKLSIGNFRLLDTFFSDLCLTQPRKVGTVIISALLLLGIDVEACIIQELLHFPFGVVKNQPFLLDKRVIFTKEGEHRFDLDWEWVHDQSAPGHLLLSELTAFTVDSDYYLTSSDMDFSHPKQNGIGPLYSNRHDAIEILLLYKNLGTGKWPPRFERRAAKKERKGRARLGQKQTRSKMPGSWVP
jgi:hypothetical protein